MLDIHGHILPQIDDGAENLEHALEMARVYEKTGVATVVATPHYIRGCYEVEKDTVLEATNHLNENIRKHNLSIQVIPGMEIEICPEIPELIKEGKILTINNNGKYLLIEPPFYTLPSYTNQIFYELNLMGITPILAHPERNQVLGNNLKMIYEMVERGVLIQVNAGSLLGYFGKEVKETVVTMLKSNLVHVIAGDAHRWDGERGPCMHLVKPILEKLVGVEKTNLVMQQHSLHIINSEHFSYEKPTIPQKGLKSFIAKAFAK